MTDQPSIMKRTERDLLDFVDTASIGLHWVAADGTILWANPADYEPLGYSAEEYIGQNINAFHSEEHVIADILRRLSAGERLDGYAARLRCKDGSAREVSITSSVCFDDRGEFRHTRCFTVDQSRRRQGFEIQIEALNREVERLRSFASHEHGLTEAILTASPHGVIVCDLAGRLVLQNAAAEQIWAGSASAESIAEWSKYRMFRPDGRPLAPHEWAMARALESRLRCLPEELHIQRFDDSHGVLIASAAPILGADGALEGALSIFTDITRLKQQEEELRLGAQRFFTTLQSIGDAVIATDAQGRIDYLNPRAQLLTRWTLEEARGRPLEEVFHLVDEATRHVVESPVARMLREPRVTSLVHDTLLLTRDGFQIPIEDNVAPIFDSKDELAGVVLVFRDASEKRREERRRRFLVEASTRLSSSLDYIPTLQNVVEVSVPRVGDWCAADMIEADGTLQRLAVAHVDPAKLLSAKELQVRYPAHASSALGPQEVIRTGRSQLLSEIPGSLLEATAVDGEHARLLCELGFRAVMIVPLRSGGQILGALTFVSSESKRKFGDADLVFAEELANIAGLAVDNARLYREAQDANRLKDEFLATVSHELRTPLNAILGWASLLRSSEVSSAQRARALEVIERNARAQAQLIEDLLDVSRIISGTLRLESRPVDLATIVESALDVVRLAADSKGVRLRADLNHDARRAMGDSGRLQQIVWNLLSNAVKFTARGGEVSVKLARVNSQTEIHVSDTGRGIAAEFLPHMFERFKQADAATTRAHGGLGLGLAIVKHLVELHGGRVTASSDGKDRGSMFRVQLPLAAVMREQDPVLGRSAASRFVVPRLDGLRVLVVDDEPDARTLLTAVLHAQGAQVESAGSAREALARIESQCPDVLVSDIGMPGEDGYSLIRKVRALPHSGAKALPAAALTAYARKEDRARALLAGFQSHVPKPIDRDELLIVVATLAGLTG